MRIKIFILFLLFNITFLFAQSNQIISFSESEKSLLGQLKKSPNNLVALEELGDLYVSVGNWSKAAEFYYKAKNEKPKVANYHFKYGGAVGMMAKEGPKHKALKYINLAKASLKKAEMLDPSSWEIQWVLVEFYTQLPYLLGGSEEVAWLHAKKLQRLSAINGHFAKAYLYKADNNFENAKKSSIRGLNLISNLNCVKNSLKKNLSCIPHNNNLNYFVGIAYNSYADQPELAINFLNNYIVNYSLKDSFSLDKVYYDLSQIYEKKKDINMAISYLDKAVKINPKFKIAISKKEQILERNER